MTRKLAALTMADTKNLMAIGALVRDELEYFDTYDDEQFLGAPVYLNRAVVGVAPEAMLDLLAEQADDVELKASKPLYIKDTLAIPEVGVFWYHRDNDQADLLAVEITYKHADVAELDVILVNGEYEDDEVHPEAQRKLLEALGIISDEDEDEEEDDEEDSTTEADDTSPLEYCILDSNNVPHLVEAYSQEEAEAKFRIDNPGVGVLEVTLATDDGSAEDEE